MGTKSSTPSTFTASQWHPIPNTTPPLLSNPVTHQQIEQYPLSLSSSKQFQLAEQLYQMRYNDPQLVSTKYLDLQESKQLCSKSHIGKIYTEHVPIRLSNIVHVPFPDVLHLYQQAFNGYHRVYGRVGGTRIGEDCVGVNEQNVVKVWNSPDFGDMDGNAGNGIGEGEMVRNIVEMIQGNTDMGSMPRQEPSFGAFLYRDNDRVGFAEAKKKLEMYANYFNNGVIPKYLACVERAGGAQMIKNKWNQTNSNMGMDNSYNYASNNQFQNNYGNANKLSNSYVNGNVNVNENGYGPSPSNLANSAVYSSTNQNGYYNNNFNSGVSAVPPLNYIQSSKLVNSTYQVNQPAQVRVETPMINSNIDRTGHFYRSQTFAPVQNQINSRVSTPVHIPQQSQSTVLLSPPPQIQTSYHTSTPHFHRQPVSQITYNRGPVLTNSTYQPRQPINFRTQGPLPTVTQTHVHKPLSAFVSPVKNSETLISNLHTSSNPVLNTRNAEYYSSNAPPQPRNVTVNSPIKTVQPNINLNLNQNRVNIIAGVQNQQTRQINQVKVVNQVVNTAPSVNVTKSQTQIPVAPVPAPSLNNVARQTQVVVSGPAVSPAQSTPNIQVNQAAQLKPVNIGNNQIKISFGNQSTQVQQNQQIVQSQVQTQVQTQPKVLVQSQQVQQSQVVQQVGQNNVNLSAQTNQPTAIASRQPDQVVVNKVVQDQQTQVIKQAQQAQPQTQKPQPVQPAQPQPPKQNDYQNLTNMTVQTIFFPNEAQKLIPTNLNQVALVPQNEGQLVPVQNQNQIAVIPSNNQVAIIPQGQGQLVPVQQGQLVPNQQGQGQLVPVQQGGQMVAVQQGQGQIVAVQQGQGQIAVQQGQGHTHAHTRSKVHRAQSLPQVQVPIYQQQANNQQQNDYQMYANMAVNNVFFPPQPQPQPPQQHQQSQQVDHQSYTNMVVNNVFFPAQAQPQPTLQQQQSLDKNQPTITQDYRFETFMASLKQQQAQAQAQLDAQAQQYQQAYMLKQAQMQRQAQARQRQKQTETQQARQIILQQQQQAQQQKVQYGQGQVQQQQPQPQPQQNGYQMYANMAVNNVFFPQQQQRPQPQPQQSAQQPSQSQTQSQPQQVQQSQQQQSQPQPQRFPQIQKADSRYQSEPQQPQQVQQKKQESKYAISQYQDEQTANQQYQQYNYESQAPQTQSGTTAKQQSSSQQQPQQQQGYTDYQQLTQSQRKRQYFQFQEKPIGETEPIKIDSRKGSGYEYGYGNDGYSMKNYDSGYRVSQEVGDTQPQSSYQEYMKASKKAIAHQKELMASQKKPVDGDQNVLKDQQNLSPVRSTRVNAILDDLRIPLKSPVQPKNEQAQKQIQPQQPRQVQSLSTIQARGYENYGYGDNEYIGKVQLQGGDTGIGNSTRKFYQQYNVNGGYGSSYGDGSGERKSGKEEYGAYANSNANANVNANANASGYQYSSNQDGQYQKLFHKYSNSDHQNYATLGTVQGMSSVQPTNSKVNNLYNYDNYDQSYEYPSDATQYTTTIDREATGTGSRSKGNVHQNVNGYNNDKQGSGKKQEYGDYEGYSGYGNYGGYDTYTKTTGSAKKDTDYTYGNNLYTQPQVLTSSSKKRQQNPVDYTSNYETKYNEYNFSSSSNYNSNDLGTGSGSGSGAKGKASGSGNYGYDQEYTTNGYEYGSKQAKKTGEFGNDYGKTYGGEYNYQAQYGSNSRAKADYGLDYNDLGLGSSRNKKTDNYGLDLDTNIVTSTNTKKYSWDTDNDYGLTNLGTKNLPFNLDNIGGGTYSFQSKKQYKQYTNGQLTSGYKVTQTENDLGYKKTTQNYLTGQSKSIEPEQKKSFYNPFQSSKSPSKSRTVEYDYQYGNGQVQGYGQGTQAYGKGHEEGAQGEYNVQWDPEILADLQSNVHRN